MCDRQVGYLAVLFLVDGGRAESETFPDFETARKIGEISLLDDDVAAFEVRVVFVEGRPA
jgi:hypothetical protein